METPAEKRCPQCAEPKPATPEYFYRDKSRKDGLTALCKVHKNAEHTRYVQGHRDHINAYIHERRLQNLEHERALGRARWWKNREKNLAASKASYQKHREKRLAKQKAYYEAFREIILAYQKQYRVKNAETIARKAHVRWLRLPKEKKVFRYLQWERRNPEKAKALRKQWRKDHPEYQQRWNRMRYARRMAALIVDYVDLLYICERDNWICHLCKKKVKRKDASIDHHFPVSKPGAIHGRQYVSLAHKRCNSARGNGRPGYPAQLRLLP